MFANKKIRLFKIYALIDKHTVFIGKTQGEIGPVYYQHRRAENSYTSKYFYPKNSKNPKMHILETLSCNSSESYRHIVAWVHIFQEEGYQIINPQGTLNDANDLRPQTVDLIISLQPISLDTFLKETEYRKLKKNTTEETLHAPEVNLPAKEKKREKITLWTAPEEKERFVAYAKSLGLTQSQTMQYLISKTELEKIDPLFPDWDSDIFTRILKASYEQKIAQLEEEVFQLKTAQGLCRADKNATATKMDQCHAIAKQAVLDFYEYFDSVSPISVDIERARYKDYMTNLPESLNYEYPHSSGSILIRMQAFLLGEGTAPARFVLGTDQHNRLIKLRFYPSKYFIGIMPGNKRFTQRNSVWYVAWKMTGKVAELISAFPLQIRPKYKNPMDVSERLAVLVDKIVAENDALCKMDEFFKIFSKKRLECAKNGLVEGII